MKGHYDKYLYLLLGITACITFFLVVANFFFYAFTVNDFRSDLTNSSITRSSYPKAFVVESGSMEPAIPTASVVFTLPQSNYQIGDIISFTQSKGDIVTHRVAGITDGGYTTQGDANEDPDNAIVAPESVIGEVVFTVPSVGRAVNQAKTPQGFILLVIVPATIIIYEELRALGHEAHKGAKKVRGKLVRNDQTQIDPDQVFGGPSPNSERRSLPTVVVVVPILGALAVIVGFTGSYFFDLETVIGNSATIAVPTPTPTPDPENNQILEVESLDSEPLTPTPSPMPTPTLTLTPTP